MKTDRQKESIVMLRISRTAMLRINGNTMFQRIRNIINGLIGIIKDGGRKDGTTFRF